MAPRLQHTLTPPAVSKGKAPTASKAPINVARYSKGSGNTANSSAGKYILLASSSSTSAIHLYNATSGAHIKAYSGLHSYDILALAVSNDNAKFSSAGGDRSVFVWDVATGNTIRRLGGPGGHSGKVNAVDFNEDASVLASGGFDATVRLWDLRAQAGRPIQILGEAKDAIQTLVVGNGIIFTGSVDGHVRTYDLRMGELKSDFIGPPITSIVPSKSLDTLLVTTLDSTIRLLDLSTGKVLNSFVKHNNTAYRCRAVFSNKEDIVLSGDDDGRLWRWDLVEAIPISTEPIPPPKAHDRVILWTEYHPLEEEWLTAGADGCVKVWRP